MTGSEHAAASALPRFMGPEHVTAMNALLKGRLRDECAPFDRDCRMHYEIVGDPDGIRSWTVTVGPDGVRFGLDEAEQNPVIVVRATYRELAAAAQATRAEKESPPDSSDYDLRDPEMFTRMVEVIEASRAIATVAVRFP